MLTAIHVKNLKGWRDTGRFPLAPITGLFGTNSSGKTSLLQLPLLLKQTADSADRGLALEFGGDNTLVTLGTLRDVLFNHDQSLPLSWRVDWTLDQDLSISDPVQGGAPIFRSRH